MITLDAPLIKDVKHSSLFGHAFGFQLQDLSAYWWSVDVLRSVLVLSPHLMKVHLSGLVKDSNLELIAQLCPNVTSLRFNSLDMTSITDAGVIAVLNGCSKLEEFAIETILPKAVAMKCLQAILKSKLRLKRLHFMWNLFTQEELSKLRLLAREHQVLPVVVINK